MRWKIISLFFSLFFGSWAVFWGPDQYHSTITTKKRALVTTTDIKPEEVFSQAFPGFNGRPFPGDFENIDRLNQQYVEWPAMLPLGTAAQVGDRTFAIQDRIVVAGSGEAMVFTPSTEKKQVTGQPVTYASDAWSQVFIPPGSSLVMVQIQVQPEGPPNCADFLLYRFALQYPGYPAVQAWNFHRNDRLGQYLAADTGCPTSGWLYFYVPTLQADIDQSWVTITILNQSGPSASIWKLSR